MRSWMITIACLVVWLSPAQVWAVEARADAPTGVLRSVVALPVLDQAGDDDESPWRIGASAVVIDESGTLLTLAEALPANAESFNVIIPNGPQATARVLRRGSTSNAVLLQLDDAAAYSQYLTPLTVADSQQAVVGMPVWSVGNAFNALELDGAASLSRGRISGIYDIPPGPPVRGRGGKMLSNYRGGVLEVSAAVNDGNQGGALVDEHGQLLGLVSLGVSRDRKLGTTVPIHLIASDLGLDLDLRPPAALDVASQALIGKAQEAAAALTLVYFQRPEGPGNPRGLARPVRVVSDDMAPYQRQLLQQQWDRYHHFQQVFYTDQAVTAVVLDPAEGLLLTSLTNLHGNAREGYLVDERLSGTPTTVSVIGIDVALDLALLQSDGPLPLPAAPFDWEPDLAAGDDIAILGRHRDGGPFTMTTGVISAVDRRPPGSRVPFVQVDALANYGNLGGMVIDRQGQVVGLTTMLGPRTPWLINSGVSMASASNAIARSLPPMRHLGGDLGRPRPGLGVLVNEAMRVVRLVPDSGAEQGGVQLGDRLVAIDEATMTDLYDLRGLLAGRAVGDELTLRIEREGEMKDLTIILGQLE